MDKKKMEQYLVNNVEQINHLVAQTRCLKDHFRYLYYKDTAQIRCLKEMKYEKLKTTHSLIITEIAWFQQGFFFEEACFPARECKGARNALTNNLARADAILLE